MNEIDNTVAELLALPDNEIASWYMSTVNCPDDMEAVALKALANAYTKAVADRDMFRVQLKRIAKAVENTRLEHPDLTVVSNMATAALLLEKIESKH